MPKRFVFLYSPTAVIAIGSGLLAFVEYLFRYSWESPAVVGYFFYWAVIVATFVALALMPRLQNRTDQAYMLVLAFLVGTTIGLISALFKFLLYAELWVAFNVLAEPLRTALVGTLIVWVANNMTFANWRPAN